jgi:hypothetical protein
MKAACSAYRRTLDQKIENNPMQSSGAARRGRKINQLLQYLAFNL